jgi:hypothetical protein
LRSATQARQFCGCILHFLFIRHRKQRRMASVALAVHVLQILLTQSDPLFVERAHTSAQDAPIVAPLPVLRGPRLVVSTLLSSFYFTTASNGRMWHLSSS